MKRSSQKKRVDPRTFSAIDRPNPSTAPAPKVSSTQATVAIGNETFDPSDPLSALALLDRTCGVVSMNRDGHTAIQRAVETLSAYVERFLDQWKAIPVGAISRPDSAAPDPKSDHPRPGSGSN